MARISALAHEATEFGPFESVVEPQEWTEAYPYDHLEPGHVAEIVEQAKARCQEILEQIKACRAHTFDTVLAPINEFHDVVHLAGGYLTQWLVNPDEAVRTAAREAEVDFWHYVTDIYYDEDFYKKFKTFTDSYEGRHLPKHKKVLADISGGDFYYAGHGLSRVKRERMRELDHELIEREIEFGYNLMSDDTSVALDESEVAGLSDRFRATLGQDAETGAYLVTMDYPTFFPYMRQASSREGRQKVSRAFFSRAKENGRLLNEIVDIRQEMAVLLGRKSWAHIALRDNMANSLDEILRFYDTLIENLTPKAKEEVALMTGMLIRDGHKGPLRDYDVDYYEDQVVRQHYRVDHERVAEYFPLDVVMEGLFDKTGQMFQINYREIDVPTWHPDVTAYAIDDIETGEELATFYMDLFPREGKYQHACVITLSPGRELANGTYRNPSAVLIANYTPPTAGRPALLSQEERAGYQYHEFGHIMHAGLTGAEYVCTSGLNTEVDMAEVPSQAMEFWGWDPDLMVKYSRHYKTGKPMPMAMAKRVAEAKNVNVALRTLERVRKGMFDLAVHMDGDTQSVRRTWRDISNEIGVVPPQPGTYFPATFGHIATGYSANYHTYERAMPICADIFERFKQRGLLDPELGMEYRRKVLEIGYARKGIETVKDFLGKVDDQPYLRSLGLTAIALR